MKFDEFGRRLNPNYGTQQVRSFQSYQTVNSNDNLWQRANGFIVGVGEWIEDNGATFVDNLTIILYFGIWIMFGIMVIGVWISQSFWMALITAIIGGFIMSFAASIAIYVFFIFFNVLFWLLRYIFYNLYVLLIVIAIVIGSILYSNTNFSFSRNNNERSAVVSVSLQPNYICTVNTTLNVREKPQSDANVVGQLRRNEEVFVHSYHANSNFAEIEFNGSRAYVSARYLKAKDANSPNNVIPLSAYE